MTQPRTFILAGGGTGGHLFPGVALALELQRREPDARLLFVGSERTLEQTILSRHQFERRSLPVEPPREVTRHPWRFLTRNWSAWRAARRLIRSEQPCAVIGLGGYASAPVVWEASRVGVPIILLEQNVVPGRATRWLSRLASVVCTSFAETSARLPRSVKVELTGTPVRLEIVESASSTADVSASTPHAPRELLVLGGSQGADSLNEAVVAALHLIGEARSGWRVVHQTGQRQLDAMRTAHAALSSDALVEAFFEDLPTRYRTASLVVSRAGATTLAELACAGLPAILLPYPYATDDHQNANALAYAARGAAHCVRHRSSTEETSLALSDSLIRLMSDDPLRHQMSLAAQASARPLATHAVVDQVLLASGGDTSHG